ncbi:transient receptor potential cation channel subfamily M member 2-like [Salvelinus sp. IW2-2015]|uniref:transient receptor potential cation channel subfamily M member 2-like n=1 Tax=Salvelinus sp. IW2-2015 TaxID=2691554 RepID=UPI0038D3C992
MLEDGCVYSINYVCLCPQLFHDPDGFGFRKKADMYINDMWNILDFLSILLFIIGLAFRTVERMESLSTAPYGPGKELTSNSAGIPLASLCSTNLLPAAPATLLSRCDESWRATSATPRSHRSYRGESHLCMSGRHISVDDGFTTSRLNLGKTELLFLPGKDCPLTTRLFYAGKVILCIDFIIFCLRLMAIFIISKTLGPKIIIVRRMMLDMFFFMFLLSIWVVAYGVAKQGILIHNEDRLDWIVRGVIYEPYLIIFGKMPSNIDNALFDIKACSVNGTEPQKPKCPILNEDKMPAFPEWLTIILLCVYLLFANILLLNLLIAIFNYTFQEVQENTDTIWKFQRYELIKEYHSRPAAPPPLILLSHIFLFIRRRVLQRPPNSYRAFSES